MNRPRRETHKPGLTSSKQRALDQLREAKERGISRADQLDLDDEVDEDKLNMSAAEYKRFKDQQRQEANDFIVGDDGYKDHGDDQWHDDEPSRKRAAKSTVGNLQAFFGKSGKKKEVQRKKPQAAKVSEAESKDIMKGVLNELDDDADADLPAQTASRAAGAMNMDDMLQSKYDIAMGPAEEEKSVESDEKENVTNSLKRPRQAPV